MIAIGGTLGEAGAPVFDGLRATIEVGALRAVAPLTRFRAGQLHNGPALLGGVAALLAVLGQGVSELPDWMLEAEPAR